MLDWGGHSKISHHTRLESNRFVLNHELLERLLLCQARKEQQRTKKKHENVEIKAGLAIQPF